MLTRITGTGDGSEPVANITFPYLDKAHVKAAIDGTPVSVRWTGTSQVTLNSTAPAGSEWVVYRDTPVGTRMADFEDASALLGTDLNTANDQVRYKTQELMDQDEDTPEQIRDMLADDLINGSGILKDADDVTNRITLSADPDYIRAVAASIKGDPGGNAMAIGTYSDVLVSPPGIPAGTDMVQTSGYSADGDGGHALFFAAAAEPADGPRFQDASGRWFGIAKGTITAASFGALESAIDAGPALNEFFSFAAANDDVRVLSLWGNLPVATPVVYDNLINEDIPRLILWGGLRLTAIAPMQILLTIRNADKFSFIGVPTLYGAGDSAYVSRTVDIGLWLELSPRATFSGINANFFRYAGVYLATTNSSVTDLGNLSIADAGSGQGLGGGDSSFDVTANWSNPVNSGTAFDAAQRTTLNVDVLPPAANDAYDRPTYADIGGELFQVMEIDRLAGTLKVHPWVPTATPPGLLTYIFGGAVSVTGGDNSVLKFGLDAKRCGIGIFAGTFYSPQVSRLVSQVCGIAFTMGDDPVDAHVGGRIDGFYCENNRYDLNRGTIAPINVSIGSDYAFNLDKVAATGMPRDVTGTPKNTPLLSTADIFVGGLRYPNQKTASRNGAEGSSKLSNYTPTTPQGTSLVYRKDDWNINLGAFDDQVNNLFGIDSGILGFMGTGAAGAPVGAGTFVFKPQLGDAVNGLPAEATANYASPASWATFPLKGPALFLIYRDVISKTWYIWPVGGTAQAVAPTVTFANPSGGAVVDVEARTSLNQLATDLADLRNKLKNAGLTA